MIDLATARSRANRARADVKRAEDIADDARVAVGVMRIRLESAVAFADAREIDRQKQVRYAEQLEALVAAMERACNEATK